MGADTFSWVLTNLLGGMSRPGVARTLDEDLAILRDRCGIRTIISLTERPLDPHVAHESGILVRHLPVPDFTPPSPEVIDECVATVHKARDHGEAVAIHCAAGIGRTGTALACVLVSFGHPPDEAILAVRRLRPGSIETREQEAAVFAYAERFEQTGLPPY